MCEMGHPPTVQRTLKPQITDIVKYVVPNRPWHPSNGASGVVEGFVAEGALVLWHRTGHQIPMSGRPVPIEQLVVLVRFMF